MRSRSRGFTLLELLIVVSIIAVLSQAVATVLNPAEILAKARDAERLNDLAAIRSAIAFYVVSAPNPELDDAAFDSNDNCRNGGATPVIYTHQSGVVAPGAWEQVVSTSTPYANDGNGWIPINFRQLESGSPLARLPVDPAPQGPLGGAQNDFYYVYACDATNLSFELMANMESRAFREGGGQDMESRDGGAVSSLYEIGSDLRILPGPALFYYWDE